MQQNDRPLKDWLQVFVQSPQLRERLYQTRARKWWMDTMGPAIARYTRQVRVDGQTMIIHVDSASLKNELSLMRDDIRDKINAFFGETWIREVRII